MHSLGAWLRRRAENVAAAMLAVMFAAFIIQIVFRYFFNFPIGWAAELSVVMWLWLVLWGAAFVLSDEEEIRFDLLSASAGRRARIIMGIISSLALVVLYGASLPATYSYVTFMKVEKASYLKVRMDWLFSIYVLFLVAILARYLWRLGYLVRGREPGKADPTGASSGL
jgi:TRAP-type C4-dicarboxylate transport system permease small subunit